MDVACLGILVADIFASPIDSLPREGELKPTDRFWMSVGGCAANTAVDLRRLNRSVAIMGKVGMDRFGDFVIDELGNHGIETSHVMRSQNLPTSSTVIVNVQGQDRRYLHCIGANAEFRLADVDFSWVGQCRVLYVGGYLATPGIAASDLSKLFKAAKERSVTTVLDVVIPAGVSVSPSQLAPVLLHTDYFLPNEDEGRVLTGERDVAEQAKCLARLNPACTVVITRGKYGSLAKCGNVLIDTAPFPVDAMDESGAGDAFSAGFITGLLENWPLEYTLCFASAVGASCTRALGCHDGVSRFDEVQQMILERTRYLRKTG
jgi:sugar/nucleoside kinase (ribokinase family)